MKHGDYLRSRILACFSGEHKNKLVSKRNGFQCTKRAETTLFLIWSILFGFHLNIFYVLYNFFSIK